MRMFKGISNRYDSITPIKSKRTMVFDDFVKDFIITPAINIEKQNLPLVQGVIYNDEFSNIEGYDTIFLDFDSKKPSTDTTDRDFTVKFGELKVEFSNLKCKFAMHTSASHTSDIHKVRVIIPLKNKITLKVYLQAKKLLIKKFWKADIAGFNVNQKFFIPVKNDNTYSYYINDGKLITLGELLGFKNDYDLRDKLRTDKFYADLAVYGTIEKPKLFSITTPKVSKYVKSFLETPYPITGGNYPLFNALLAAISANDIKSVESIIQKAYRENWTKYEIEQKLKSAKAFINNNKQSKRF